MSYPKLNIRLAFALLTLCLVSACSSVPMFDVDSILSRSTDPQTVGIGLQSFLIDEELDGSSDVGSAQRAALDRAKSNGLAYAASHGLYVERQNVSTRCFVPKLRKILRQIEAKFDAKIIVTSGYRSPSANRRAGGSRGSKHISCEAADIYVPGVEKSKVIAYARKLGDTGGVGCYPGRKFFHVDVRARISGYHHRPMYFRGCPKSWHTPRKKDGSWF